MVENPTPQGKQPAFRVPQASSLTELREKEDRMEYYKGQGQTDDFSVFRTKIENKYGCTVEQMATRFAPDTYGHLVLSHGFMEYANVRGLTDRYGNANKDDYLEWAKINGLPEHLLEQGWEEFVND